MFVEGLEDKTPEIRAGACEALGKLKVSSGMRNVQLYTSDFEASVEVEIIMKPANSKNLSCM